MQWLNLKLGGTGFCHGMGDTYWAKILSSTVQMYIEKFSTSNLKVCSVSER